METWAQGERVVGGTRPEVMGTGGPEGDSGQHEALWGRGKEEMLEQETASWEWREQSGSCRQPTRDLRSVQPRPKARSQA